MVILSFDLRVLVDSKHRRAKLGAQVTASFDTVLHITNDLKTLCEKFNIVVKL